MWSFRLMEKLGVWCLHVAMLGHQGALPTKHSPSVQTFRLRVVEGKNSIYLFNFSHKTCRFHPEVMFPAPRGPSRTL